MGFGGFLGKLGRSPFKGTKQALTGHPLQAFKTGITGGGTAPFAKYAPLLNKIGRQPSAPNPEGMLSSIAVPQDVPGIGASPLMGQRPQIGGSGRQAFQQQQRGRGRF